MEPIAKLETCDERELLERLHATRLTGHDRFPIYRDAELTLETHDPSALVPAQRYVLVPTVREIKELRAALLARGVDIFAMRGGAWFTTEDGRRRPVIPPVVEESEEESGTVLLINDGIHRIAAARDGGEKIAVVVARNVPREYPYYAYPWPGGWDEMDRLECLPPGNYQKKLYRREQGYQQLYRVFTADDVFPGVQEERANTNPTHLTP